MGTEMLLLGFWEGVVKGPKRPHQKVKDWRVVVVGFRRCGLYHRLADGGYAYIGPRGTSSLHQPTQSPFSWAAADASSPIPRNDLHHPLFFTFVLRKKKIRWKKKCM